MTTKPLTREEARAILEGGGIVASHHKHLILCGDGQIMAMRSDGHPSYIVSISALLDGPVEPPIYPHPDHPVSRYTAKEAME